jgi:hypothetical protein
MFETTSRLAEKAATSVSRRRFLGSLGRLAGATALAVAGTLAFGGAAQASGCPRGTSYDRLCGCIRYGNCCPGTWYSTKCRMCIPIGQREPFICGKG